MSKNSVRVSLEGRLLPWAKSKGIEVSVENVTFKVPDSSVTYLRATVMPALSGGGTLCGGGDRGLFQVDVFHKKGKGPAAAEKLADEIAALFHGFNGYAKVPAKPTVMQGDNDPAGHYHVPVRIAYIT